MRIQIKAISNKLNWNPHMHEHLLSKTSSCYLN